MGTYGWFNFSTQPDAAIDKWHKQRDDAAKAEKRERLACLRRKYHDVPLRHAVMNLFWREAKLTISDIAEILETDEKTVKTEIDTIRQDAR